jgi:hypothetical protein
MIVKAREKAKLALPTPVRMQREASLLHPHLLFGADATCGRASLGKGKLAASAPAFAASALRFAASTP